MPSALWTILPFLILLTITVAVTMSEVEGFQATPAQYRGPQAPATLSLNIQDEIMANARQNCADLGRRIGEILEISNKEKKSQYV